VTVDFAEVERELCRIPEISAARIVTNDLDRPVEVHILASAAKLAKQVVRDVQSVALAAFGLELDRRVISVVQLEGTSLRLAAPTIGPVAAGPGANAASPVSPPSVVTPPLAASAPPDAAERVAVIQVQTAQTGRRFRVDVVLKRGATTATGSAEGLYSERATARLAALATLDGLRQLQPEADRIDLESATVIHLAERAVALVAVVLVDPPHEEALIGSAVIRMAGPLDAIARALLDAANRRLSQPQ
jgi:hypothetical protein